MKGDKFMDWADTPLSTDAIFLHDDGKHNVNPDPESELRKISPLNPIFEENFDREAADKRLGQEQPDLAIKQQQARRESST